MSDTPNTDAQVACDWTGGVPAVPYEFAQDQERHINSLETIIETQRQSIEALSKALNRWMPAGDRVIGSLKKQWGLDNELLNSLL